jgi:TPP-dependent pyruvate/acetoin dehydrogenase alpha subunit
MNKNLVELDNPNFYNNIINIESFSNEDLLEYLKKMIFIRMVEDFIAIKKRDGLIGGPVHLGAGQEAIAVGVSSNLTSDDKVFSTHRSHAHLLALNGSMSSLFAELLGRYTGLSRGMGGSMHLIDKSVGFYGSVPIVGGTIALAVGAALSEKLLLRSGIGVAYIGDGATEEGVFHESMNLASKLKVPVIFVVENNLFASHLHISQRQPCTSVSRFAFAHDIDYQVVDGNNIVDVINSSRKLINNARKKSLPGLLEAVTFRRYGHVDWREDIDVGVNRSEDDIRKWKVRDPINRLFNSLELKGIINRDDLLEINNNYNIMINNSWLKANNDPYPSEKDLINWVYQG